MSKRLTLYIADESQAVIGPENPATSRAGRINSIIQRYGAIIRDAMPEFSQGEWCAIVDANNGSILDDMPQTVAYTWANVHDSPELGDKWGIDQAALVDKLRSLTYAQKCAVAEVIAGFWNSEKLNQADNHTLLTEAGAKIAERMEKC